MTPNRDGVFDSIPIHEVTHGIASRLTGGSRAANCLNSQISRGMGEGWSDAMAVFMLRRDGETRDLDVAIGSYVIGLKKGIRSKPYSTKMEINPYTFSYIGKLHEVHAIGEYLTLVLYEMYWNLVEKYGFSADLFNASQMKGNIISIQLLITALKLQPCNPTMTNYRDALISADIAHYKGANKCLIYKAFAKRGMGIDSVETSVLTIVTITDGFKLPLDCI